MKKHGFTILILAASLLLCGGAWLLKTRWLPSRAVEVRSQAQVSAGAPDPLEGFTLVEPFGAVWDEVLSQWTLREKATLRGGDGAFARALENGVVRASHEDDGVWTVVLEQADGALVHYGGLRSGLPVGRRLSRGEIVGQLAGDALFLGRQNEEGMWTECVP